MKRENLIEVVKNIIVQEVKISLNGVGLSTKLEDIGVDSLDTVKLAVVFEESFNIKITTTELLQIETFGDIIDGLEQKLDSK